MKNDSIINKFLTRNYSNNAQLLYIYIHGKPKCKELIINNILSITYEVFGDLGLKKNIIAFLENKKSTMLGEKTTIKTIY